MTVGPAIEPSVSWLDDLPDYLSRHARIMRALVVAAADDARLRAVQVQGSVGRGDADRLSDLDLGVVVAESAWPAITDKIPTLIRRLGPVVDDHFEFLPGPDASEVFRAWVQFEDGIQLDMAVLPARRLLGSGPDGRPLFDRDEILLVSDHPMRLTYPQTVSKWDFLCWHDLAQSVKNIDRNRLAAAIEFLGSARLATISCWGAAHGVDYAGLANVVAAGLGVTCPWPDGLEKTYPTPDRASVLAAAVALSELQGRTEILLGQRLGLSPRPLGGWVTARLRSLQEEPPSRDSRPARSSRPGTRPTAMRRRAQQRAARRPQ